ncbi:MAG: c-type cytochrome [Planctomycetaceae bacterium]
MRYWFIPLIVLLGLLPLLIAADPPTASTRQTARVLDRSPMSLSLSPDGHFAVTANHTANSVSLVELATGRVVAEQACGRRPIDVAWWDASTVLVSLRDDDAVAVLRRTATGLEPRSRIPVGDAPHGLALLGSGKTRRGFVAVSGADEVVELDVAHARVKNRLKTGGQPRWLVAAPNDRWVISCANVPGEVWVHDVVTGKLVSRRTVFDDAFNLGQPIVLPDSSTVIIPHPINRSFPVHEDNVQKGWVIDNRLTKLPLPSGEYWQQKQMNLDEHRDGCGDVHALALGPDNKWLVATCGGSHDLLILRFKELPWPSADPGDFLPDAMRGNTRLYRRVELGGRPLGVGFLDSRRVVVANYFLDALQVINVESATLERTISLGAAPQPSLSRRGEQIFYDADRSLDGWFSCHSCHTDGHTAGQTFDTLNDGNFDTYKLTPSLRGVSRTGPWTWHGWQKSLPASLRKSLKTTLSTPREPTEDDIRALMTFLTSLDFPASPLRRSDGSLGPAAKRGQMLFSNKAGCSACHAGNDFTTPATYKVGLESPRYFFPEFNPPSLRGLHDKRRFLHDGRAHNLKEILVRHHRPRELGGEKLNDSELRDLVAYLKSL